MNMTLVSNMERHQDKKKICFYLNLIRLAEEEAIKTPFKSNTQELSQIAHSTEAQTVQITGSQRFRKGDKSTHNQLYSKGFSVV